MRSAKQRAAARNKIKKGRRDGSKVQEEDRASEPQTRTAFGKQGAKVA